MLFSRFVHSSFLALPYTHTHTHTFLSKLHPAKTYTNQGIRNTLDYISHSQIETRRPTIDSSVHQRQRQQSAVSNKKYSTARTQNQAARNAQSLSIRRLQPAEERERERETEWKEMDRAGRGRTKRCFMTIYETSIFFPFVHCLSESRERQRENPACCVLKQSEGGR